MADLQGIERRFTELEGEVKGEKLVTRHVLDQLRQNTDILLELRRETTKIGDAVALQGAQLTALESKLAGIVADAMRDVMRSRRAED